MFDLAWSEIAVIGVVAVLVLGPKELPQAMRTMAKVLRKMRSLTSELQGHMNEIVREAELDEVRRSIQKISSTSLSQEMTKLVDPTGEVQAKLNESVTKYPAEATPEELGEVAPNASAAPPSPAAVSETPPLPATEPPKAST